MKLKNNDLKSKWGIDKNLLKFNKILILALCFIACFGLVNGEGIDENTVLMMHMDDAGLTDSSANNHTITSVEGDVTKNTIKKKFGDGSAYFPGGNVGHEGPLLRASKHTDWDFGSNEFTIDFWAYPTVTKRMGFFKNGDYFDSPKSLGIDCEWSTSAGNYNIILSTFGNYADLVSVGFPHSITTNAWNHIAIVRENNTLYYYINGAEGGEAAIPAGDLAYGDFDVGANNGGVALPWTGYIDEFRISKGIARWTNATCNGFEWSCFDEPTEAYSIESPKLIISTSQPTNNSELSFGTTDTTLGVSTNLNANCKYSTSAGQEFAVMTAFSTTGAKSHSSTLTGLINGGDYDYHIKCNDTATGNVSDDYLIHFNVSDIGIYNINFNTESNWMQEDDVNGTDFDGGKVILQMSGIGGVDSDTKLLLHMEGIDGSTTFIDSSSQGHTFTANNNAEIDAAQYKFGTASGLFTTNTDYITSASSEDWNLGGAGGGDFTIDFWVRFDGTWTTTQGFLRTWPDGGSNGWIYWYNGDSNTVLLWTGSGTSRGVSWNPLANNWYHIALVRESSTISLYVNGLFQGIFADGDFNNDGQVLQVGHYGNSYTSLEGWLDEVRISKGIARWTSDFIPPTMAYGSSSYPITPYYIYSNNSQLDTSSWSIIKSVTTTETLPSGTSIKYLVSFDGRSSWKYWDGDSWETSSLDNLQTNGMPKTTLEAITESQWSLGFSAGTLDFAIDLGTTNPANTPELSGITILYTEGAAGCTDIDNDGYGAIGSNLTLCTYHIAYDCNDSSNATYPGAYDIPNDGIDQDCSGSDATADYKTDIIFTGESYAGLYYYYGDDIGYEITFKKDDVLSNEDVSNIVVNLTDPQGNVIKSQDTNSMTYTSAGTWTGLFTTDDLSNVFDDKVALNVYVYGITSNILTSSSHSDENLVTGTSPNVSSTTYTVVTEAISNYTVKDLVINSTEAKIDWSGIKLDLHARNIDLDSALTIGDRSAYLDSAGYSELNNSAVLTFENVNCSSPYVFYSDTADTRSAILAEDNQCLPPQCTNIQCVGNTLTVTVSSFSGYAAEADANLSIDADDPKFVGQEVHFTADYRNVTDGIFISGAACTIYFTDGNYPMAEGAIYTYNRTFVTEGLKEYNVTCSKTGFSTLTAFDNATITSAEIPEFSMITLGLGLVAILIGLVVMRKKK